MSDAKEVSYQCSADETHKPWSGIAGEIPAVCPECGAEGIEIGQIGETGETGETGATGEADDLEDLEKYDGELAKYRITGLVDIFDEQGVIRGQFPIGSIQELPTEYGDVAVDDGRAEKVDNEDTEEVE